MLDLIFCLPVLLGCQTRIKPDGDLTPRICPRCHNAAVQSAKSRMWFELCFVPLVPLKSKHIWICPICQWTMAVGQGWQPQVAGDQNYASPQQQGMMSPQAFQPGYQPSYPPPPGTYQTGYQQGYTAPVRKQG